MPDWQRKVNLRKGKKLKGEDTFACLQFAFPNKKRPLC